MPVCRPVLTSVGGTSSDKLAVLLTYVRYANGCWFQRPTASLCASLYDTHAHMHAGKSMMHVLAVLGLKSSLEPRLVGARALHRSRVCQTRGLGLRRLKHWHGYLACRYRRLSDVCFCGEHYGRAFRSPDTLPAIRRRTESTCGAFATSWTRTCRRPRKPFYHSSLQLQLQLLLRPVRQPPRRSGPARTRRSATASWGSTRPS